MLASGVSFKGLIGSLTDPSVEETSESRLGWDTETGGDAMEETLALEPKRDPTLVVNGAVAVGVDCVIDEDESDAFELPATGAVVVSTFHIRREPKATSGVTGLAGGSIFHILNALHPEDDFFAPSSLFWDACEGSRSNSA